MVRLQLESFYLMYGGIYYKRIQIVLFHTEAQSHKDQLSQ